MRQGRPIELRGLSGRGPVYGAVVVLRGATRRELGRACALAAVLADSCVLVAVNGGLASCRASRRRPDLFVGDADSFRRVPKKLPAVLLKPDKDRSDLAAALAELRRRGARIVTVAGLLGGRLDHEWANLLELGCASQHFAALIAPTERGVVLVTSRGCRASTVRGRLFSLFALCGQAKVTLRGARWDLRGELLRPGSRGLSNVTGRSLDLKVHRGAVALVFPSVLPLRPGR